MEINSWGVDSTWTLFLDRDGVINDRIFGGYVLDWNDFHFLPGVLEGLAHVRGKFARIVVVTNQQCVALEKISQDELALIHHRMCQQVAESGGNIDAVFAAIELKNDPASRRKPNINMALEAQALFPEIDCSKSIMVGDTDTDLQFGKALGMKTVLIESRELVTVPSDFRCSALSTFLHKI